MSLINGLRSVLPLPLRKVLRNTRISVLDALDVAARRKEMIPPRRMRFVGEGSFTGIGNEFRNLFVQYGGLQPEDTVLEVGSGIGRIARSLTGYLAGAGRYEGFDIVKMGVEWCQKNISPRYPNFHFHHADIRNKFYNPSGKYEASSFTFPYEDASFDFVFLTSVFTHMFPPDVEHYLREISRVLRSGGTSFITLFLINPEAVALSGDGKSWVHFDHKIDGCFTANPENPEHAIGLDESYVLGLLKECNLSIDTRVHYGKWCGRQKYLSFQDIVISAKV
jgi:SAM-dependent methyltransferase